MELIAEELAHARMRRDGIGDQAAFRELRNEMVQLGETEKQVDFRNLGLQLLLVPLDEATDRHDRLDAFLFQLGGTEDGVDRFPFRGIDEPARVHENHVRRRQLRRHHGAVADQLAHEPLRVHRRLVAAEGDDAQFHPR